MDRYTMLAGKVIFSLVFFLAALVIAQIIKRSIDFGFRRVSRRLSGQAVAKTRTVKRLLKNAITILTVSIAVLVIIAYWGVNILPILTGAGIFGIAISFGSQTLVKDIISGFFIIIEDQYSLGDKVKIDKHEGEVDNITLRMTVLKDKEGNSIYIPNSQVTTVLRYNSKPKIATVRFGRRRA